LTNSELAALELQARIMGWAPAVTEDVVIEVPGPRLVQDGASRHVQFFDEASSRILLSE